MTCGSRGAVVPCAASRPLRSLRKAASAREEQPSSLAYLYCEKFFLFLPWM